MRKKLTFIDLFSGCGGLSEGFLQSGHYRGLAHVEWEIPMIRTLRRRLESRWNHTADEAFRKTIHFDIQKTDELLKGSWQQSTLNLYGNTNHRQIIYEGLKGLIGEQKVDIVIGGPPCQAYSFSGRAQDKNSMKYDYRNYLFESFIKVVDAFEPDVFVFENVPGMLSACPGGEKVTQRIYNSFNDYGYDILNPENFKYAIQNASDFGVAQNRERVIIIGVRKGVKNKNLNLKNIYNEINRAKVSGSKTLMDAIGHLPKFTPMKNVIILNNRKVSHGPIFEEIHDNFIPRFQNKRDINIFRKWIMEDMNTKTQKERIDFYNNVLGKQSKHGKYRNLNWYRPSQTIVAHLQKDGLLFIHPDVDQARTITVKEAALIQSFPDDFEFPESMGYNYKMIGNAVPPVMAERIAGAIAEVYSLQSVEKSAVQV